MNVRTRRRRLSLSGAGVVYAPAIVSPVDEYVAAESDDPDTVYDLTFSVAPADYADGYQWQISFNDITFALPIYDEETLTETWSIGENLPYTTLPYYWRVRRLVNGIYGIWSAPRSFTLHHFDSYYEDVIQPNMLVYAREASVPAITAPPSDNVMYTDAPGPELVTNGDGTTLTGWSTNGTPTTLEVTGGRFHVITDANAEGFAQSIAATIWRTYTLEFDLELISGQFLVTWMQTVVSTITATGLQHINVSFVATAGGANNLTLRSAVAGVSEFYIDNITVKETGILDASYVGGITLDAQRLLGYSVPVFNGSSATMQLDPLQLEAILPQTAGQMKGSISAVVNWSQENWEELASRVIYDLGVDLSNRFALYHDGTIAGDLRFLVNIGGVSVSVTYVIPKNLYGKPVLVTGTWDEALDVINLYVNGALVDTDVFPNGIWTASVLTAAFCRIGSVGGASFMFGSAGAISFKDDVYSLTQNGILSALLEYHEGIASLNPQVLFEDNFSVDDAAPVANPMPATPGPGSWTITDTAGRFSKSAGVLASTNPATIATAVAGPVPRRPGVAVMAQVTRTSGTGGFGWRNTLTPGSGYGQLLNGFQINNNFPNVVGSLGSYVHAIPNDQATALAVVLQSIGALYFKKVSGTWVLVWMDYNRNDGMDYLHWINDASSVISTDIAKIEQLDAPFNEDYGIAHLRDLTLASGDDFVGLADAITDFNFGTPTSPSAGHRVELRFRKQDDNNYLTAYILRNAGNTNWDFFVDEVIAGTPANLYTANNVGDNRGIRVMHNGQRIYTYLRTSNNLWTARSTLTSEASFQTETGVEIIWTATLGTTTQNFVAIYPYTHAAYAALEP